MDTLPIYLRALEISDLERTYIWHNDSETYQNLGGHFCCVSREAEKVWIKKKAAFSNNEVNMAICLVITGGHIGNVYLRNTDWVSHTVEASGILIGDPNYRALGLGYAAQFLQISHAFKDLHLKKVSFYILIDNPCSTRLVEKCGFVQEACLRRHVFKDGIFKDVKIYSVLAEEFFSSEAQLIEIVKTSIKKFALN